VSESISRVFEAGHHQLAIDSVTVLSSSHVPSDHLNFRISTTRTICASHQLRLPDGSMEPLHGHNWAFTICVGSDELDAMQTVMDFHELERNVNGVLDRWHNQHLNHVDPFAAGVINPTAERVAQAMAAMLELPPHVTLIFVEVTEAPGCIARYSPK
jgi:6-pyruvoyltetrahydropterin/6-carboxytetrahydropterin synthase